MKRSDVLVIDNGGGGSARFTAYGETGYPVGYGATRRDAIRDLDERRKGRTIYREFTD